MIPTTASAMVREFHEAFGCWIGESDTAEVRQGRANLIAEEQREVAEALLSGAPLADVAKELADLDYVVHGTALALGIDLDLAVRLVHESNMSKLGPDGRPIIREDGKVLKGPNYRPPDVSAAVSPESYRRASELRGEA